MTTVSVSQLTSKANGNTFLNVKETFNMIGVWTHSSKCPTFFLEKGNAVALLQFEDEMSAKEYFETDEQGVWYKNQGYIIRRLGTDE